MKCGLGCIAWKSAKQPAVCRSSSYPSAEAEYIAAGEIAKEAQYFYDLDPQLGLQLYKLAVGIDNQAAKRSIEDSLSAARTRHIETVFHHLREKVQRQ